MMYGRSAPARLAPIVLVVFVLGCSVARQPALGGESSGEVAPRPDAVSVMAARSWRDAAQTSDWVTVAERIAALPPKQRREPLARYARALAASRLGDCEIALRALDGIARQLPLLRDDIARLEAECRLAIGPFAAAAEYYEALDSTSALLDAALAWQRAGAADRARELVERVLEARRLRQSQRVRARALRAELAEKAGERELAARDYLWLALEAALPGADTAYERVAQRRLTKRERLQRASALAEQGEAERVVAELARMKRAPGSAPSRAELLRTEARGYYRARVDDERAASMFERAARLDGSVRDLFSAARAWTRAGELERARALYERIERSHRSRRSGERASFDLGRLAFAHGRWREAERRYTDYLKRYRARRYNRHREEASFERALSRLARGRSTLARRDFAALRRKGSRQYSQTLLEYLEAVAEVSSADSASRARGVSTLQSIVRRSPLSFVGLGGRARLEALGQPVPRALEPLEGPESKELELELPANVQLLAELGLYGAAERTLRAEEKALRSQHEPRGTEALCRSYAAIGSGARSFSIGASLSKAVLRTGPSADNLWAWQCLYPRPYERLVLELEARHGLPHGLVHAVMRTESSFHPQARSPVGATGLMQLMPRTAQRAAEELQIAHEPDRLTDVRYNLELGSFYLGKLLSTFDQRVALTVAAYNAGPHAVARWLQGGELALDLWVARIPYDETRNYVMRVLGSWARYRYLRDGEPPELPLAPPQPLELAASAY